jgi:hypothetical protein
LLLVSYLSIRLSVIKFYFFFIEFIIIFLRLDNLVGDFLEGLDLTGGLPLVFP